MPKRPLVAATIVAATLSLFPAASQAAEPSAEAAVYEFAFADWFRRIPTSKGGGAVWYRAGVVRYVEDPAEGFQVRVHEHYVDWNDGTSRQVSRALRPGETFEVDPLMRSAKLVIRVGRFVNSVEWLASAAAPSAGERVVAGQWGAFAGAGSSQSATATGSLWGRTPKTGGRYDFAFFGNGAGAIALSDLT